MSQQLTTTHPVLWPVTRGTNWISCAPLQKALLQAETFQNIAWFKCVARCQTDDPQWIWKAGMDNEWKTQKINGSKYELDTRGLLQITNVTDTDNNTEYRCTLQTDHGQESFHIILILMPEEGNIF